MKKMMILMVAAMAAIFTAAAPAPATEKAPEKTPATATTPADAPAVTRETRTYDYRDFDGIEAGWIYKVEVTQARSYSVRVEAPDYVMPYLAVTVQGGRLRLDISSLPRDIRRLIERGNHAVNAYITLPELSEVRLSGAARMTASGAFSTGDRAFHLFMSGAARLEGLDINARKGEIDASGAAYIHMAATFIRLDADLSSAVNCVMDGNVGDALVELSGASFLNLRGELGSAEVRASGASGFTLEGPADALHADASGASKIYAEKAPVRAAEVELSGASVCRIEVAERLTVDLSGASKCRYRGPERLALDVRSIARGSSLTRL